MCIKGKFHVKLSSFFTPTSSQFHPISKRLQTFLIRKYHKLSFQVIYSASLVAMKKVSPSQSTSPNATEDSKQTQNSNIFSMPAQNTLFPNILGKIIGTESFTSLI